MLSYLFFSFAASLANTMLVGMGLAKRLIPGQITSTVTNFIISVTCVHAFGLYGIVVGALAGYAIAAFFYYRVMWQELSVDFSVGQFIRHRCNSGSISAAGDTRSSEWRNNDHRELLYVLLLCYGS